MTIQGEPLVRFEWIGSNLGLIGERLWEHIVLTAIAVSIGLLISFGLSLLIRWNGRLYLPITSVAGVLYTIPSLALFALLIPITGLSVLTAEIGLISYTLLILTRNIVGGLQSVPADAREAAIGMGYTSSQLLWRIELPLALPVIIAGIRVATVTTIGLVTVTALIGQGGLGQFILLGIQRFFYTPLVVGAVLSIALAVAVDMLLVGLQRLAAPWTAVSR
jgi:osmoprotectant transport system permease protein